MPKMYNQADIDAAANFFTVVVQEMESQSAVQPAYKAFANALKGVNRLTEEQLTGMVHAAAEHVKQDDRNGVVVSLILQFDNAVAAANRARGRFV